jgi:hypothetical protein
MIAGQTVSITFASGTLPALVAQDLDLTVGGVEQTLIDGAASGASWQVVAAGQVIDIISGTSTIGAGATVTIEIGTNATAGGTGTNQITNPAVGSYTISMDVGSAVDTGETRIAIVDVVTVTASVDTVFNFTVVGVNSSSTVNGDTTTGTSTSTTVPFGTLAADTPSTIAQDLSVTTNAANGFVVTVQTDQQLLSANGADIDGFFDGTFEPSPTAWAAPVPVLGTEDTYGHWGLTSDDTDEFPSASEYVSASTTPVQIFRNTGPTDGTVTGQGTTRVGYTVEISDLQEAATDYTATLTYVATPVF